MNTPQTPQDALSAIHVWEPYINAFLEVFEDTNQTGLPIAIKDAIATKDGHTTAGSSILATYSSPFDATVVARLKKSGAAIIGKTNLDEFAMGSSSEYSAFKPVKNPWNIEHVAGGSSGGSAAAVASGEVFGAIGTDTGGSVRQPASFCGVVGVKPTYGRVSRHGLIAYGSSFDQAGTFARTVKNAALLLELIAGPDTLDATSSQVAVGKYVDACSKPIAGLTIGMPKEFFADGINAQVKVIVQEAIHSFTELGATVQEISLPLTPAAIAVYYIIAKAEASSNLARYDGMRYAIQEHSIETLVEYTKNIRGNGFGAEVKRAILMGTYALSSGYSDKWYGQALKVRSLIRKEYESAFAEVDVIAGPVSPEAAFLLGSKSSDPLAMYLADAYTVPISVAGLPALSVPCGMTNKGLPVGLQIIAPHFNEETMFAVASAYEDAHSWKDLTPSLPK